jgi:hypothetical protein
MGNISFAVQVIADKFQLFEANSDMPLEQALPKILQACIGNSVHEEIDLKHYRVLIAYQLASSETNVRTISLDAAAPISTQGFTIRDLKLKSGFFLIFVKVPISATKLELITQRQRLALLGSQEEFLLGRTDEQRGIFPEVDIARYLPAENENKISRQQAIIFGDDSKWFIKLHDESRTSVFINNEQLERGRNYEIKDDVSINLGSDPEKPLLRIVARIVAG